MCVWGAAARPPPRYLSAAAAIVIRRRRRVNYLIENHLIEYIAYHFQAVLIFQPIKFEFYYNCLDNSSFTSEFILYIHFIYPTALYIHKFKNNLKGRSSVGRESFTAESFWHSSQSWCSQGSIPATAYF